MPRPRMTIASRYRVAEAAVLLALLALFVALRLPLLRRPALLLGWNSDAAIFGLMGKRMFEGTAFPIFFWKQSYMGTLTSMLSALAGLVLRQLGAAQTAGPLALRLAASFEVALALAFFWLALRKAFGPPAALLATIWLALGPRFMLAFSYAPVGAEQALLMAALLYWSGVRLLDAMGRREPLRGRSLAFGLVAGVGWWINQGMVFVLAAVVVVLLLRSEAWQTIRPRLRPLDRLAVRGEALAWRPLASHERAAFLAVNALLLLWTLVGLLSLFIHLPAFFLYSPFLDPLALLAGWLAFAELTFRRREAGPGPWRREGRAAIVPLLAAVAGFVAGYAPVILGEYAGWYPRSYGLSVPPMPPSRLASQLLSIFRLDLPMLIGSSSGAGVVAAALLVALLVAALWRHRAGALRLLALTPGGYGGRAVAAATIGFAFLFYLFSYRAAVGHPVRYAVAALPMLYAFAAEEAIALLGARGWRRAVAAVVTVAIALSLYLPQVAEVQKVVGGEGEPYGGLPGGVDPRPILSTIVARGYTVCYADYWFAYKLAWVSEERVGFIPLHSLDRTPAATLRLERLPGPRCRVTGEGAVVDYDPSAESRSVSEQARERESRMAN